MLRFLLVTVTGLFATLMISGCAKTDSEEQIIPRATDDIRLYQANDFISYNVSGSYTDTRYVRNGSNNFIYPNAVDGFCEPEQVTPSNTQPFTGSLAVSWSANNNLTLPTSAGGGSIAVLREESTLTLTPGGSWSSVRYITQDPSTGEVTVRAFEDNLGINDYFWASTARIQIDKRYTNGTTVFDDDGNVVQIDIANRSITQSPSVLASPLPSSGEKSVDYFINAGCDGVATCAEELRHYTGNQTFIGENTGGIEFYFDRINPLGYLFAGRIEDTSTTLTSETELFDIRAFCSAGGNGIAGFSGALWILPELGTVKIENASCIDPVITYVVPTRLFPTNPDRPDVSCAIDPGYDPELNAAAATGAAFVTESRHWVWSAEISNTNIALPQ